MKLAKFSTEGQTRVGRVEGDAIIAAPVGTVIETLLDPGARPSSADHAERFAVGDVALLPPIRDNALVIGIGLNTKSHFVETSELMSRTPGDYPPHPRLFTRTMDSLVGHLSAIELPRVSSRLDYEGEIGIVIGTGGRNIAAADALSHIGGYTCCNDGSVRDYQMHSSQVIAGKNFVSSGAAGPWLVTADAIADPQSLTLETRINGEVRQNLVMDDLIFGIADLIAYLSQIFLLRPGDLILTGSPAGIGAIGGRWLRADDVVEVSVPAIGTLSNTVA